MPGDSTLASNCTTHASAPQLSDEELRLRERLKAKQERKELDRREDDMRNKLKEKAERRRSSGGYSSSSAPDKGRGRSLDRGSGHRRGPRDDRGRRGYDRRREDYYGSRQPFVRGPPPPPARGGGIYRGDYRRGPRHADGLDDFGRRRPTDRSSSPGRGSSYYASSYSEAEDERSRSRSRSHGRSRQRRGGRGRSRSRSSSVSSGSSASSYSSRSSYSSNSSASSRSSRSSGPDGNEVAVDTDYSKDQRTVFVNQLVMRTTERDLKKYFKSKGLVVNDVILLRDKRTGRHKGCAYVEFRQMENVSKALALTGQVPSFQRFPILIKASEAEKNYVAAASQQTIEPLSSGAKVTPVMGPNGKLIESQRVYVGSLDPSVTQEHLFALFSNFGALHKVALQVDPSTGISKGFGFLTFSDPKEANLAIQTMSGQVLAGRPIKTGWANYVAPTPNIEIVQSEEFPPDAKSRTEKAYSTLAQLTMGAIPSSVAITTTAAGAVSTAAPPRVGTVAEARASLAAAAAGVIVSPPVVAPAAPLDPAVVGNGDSPTPILLVHNMFDKDVETEKGWEDDLQEEFKEECSKFGQILTIKVMSQEVGGKIYAKFDSIESAQKCAATLAGRWFDKRLLRVEFVQAVPE